MRSSGKAPSAVAQHDQYVVEQDLRTMQGAHEIKKDKKRHAKVKNLARQHLKAMSHIAKGTPGADGELAAVDENTL
jgi:hypothetical protein